MPRHPPCALKHLITTRCSHPLCNTQHTTTPQPHKPPPPTQRQALDGPGQEQPEKTTRTNRVSSQDPTVCRTTTCPNRSLCSTQPHPPALIPTTEDPAGCHGC